MRFFTDLVTEFIPSSGRRRLIRPLIACGCDDPCFVVVVPCGFESDFASVPKFFHNFIDNDESWIARAAVLHDWLYSERLLTRSQCDRILRDACVADGAPRWAAWVVWASVRLFGGRYWRS